MDKDTRNAIERATQRARKLLEEDFAAQLEGDFDVHRDGAVAAKAGGHLSARQAFQRERIVAAIEHKRAAGMSAPTPSRLPARRRLHDAQPLRRPQDARGPGPGAGVHHEGRAVRRLPRVLRHGAGLPLLPDSAGYRLYIESLFDELSTEVKVLFDRRDPSSVLWPKRATFEQLLEILNATELARVWGEDETIGWVYQFFNGQDERRKMREESQAPRNSRELAVRNQFFTPRYVVQFLTDNTLGRIWYEMRGTKTALAEKCEYMVRKPGEEFAPRAKKDPRDLRVLDPACGSGHFLLYAFDLLLAIYEEALRRPGEPEERGDGQDARRGLPEPRRASEGRAGARARAQPPRRRHRPALRADRPARPVDARAEGVPRLRHRARRARADPALEHRRGRAARRRRADRQGVRGEAGRRRARARVHVAGRVAEPRGRPRDAALRVEQLVARQAKRAADRRPLRAARGAHPRGARALRARGGRRANTRRRLFADDAAHGVALLERRGEEVRRGADESAVRRRERAREEGLREGLPADTKNDIYAAFVERGVELLTGGWLRRRIITSRTGFFLSSFQKWREEVLLEGAAWPVVLRRPWVSACWTARWSRRRPTASEAGWLEETGTSLFLCGSSARTRSRTRPRVAHCRRSRRAQARATVGRVFSTGSRRVFRRSALPQERRVRLLGRASCEAVRRCDPASRLGRADGERARQAVATSDDFRFVRLAWEVADDRDIAPGQALVGPSQQGR